MNIRIESGLPKSEFVNGEEFVSFSSLPEETKKKVMELVRAGKLKAYGLPVYRVIKSISSEEKACKRQTRNFH